MKHVLVTNGRNWLHNVYTIEKGQEWLKKHPDRKDAYISMRIINGSIAPIRTGIAIS